MELVFCALLLIVIAVVWWRRRREKSGTRCWNCGTDLRGSAQIDVRRDWRCPECGDLIEADEPGRVDRL